MNKIKKIAVFILALTMVCGALTGCKPEPEPPKPEPKVTKIEVIKEPTKTEYYIDEEFSAAGGSIKAYYDDETTTEVEMTDVKVTFDPPVSTAEGDASDLEDGKWKRTATVRFGGKMTMFDIYVSYEEFTVTFDHNYGNIKETKTARKGYPVTEPEEPTRAGNWKFTGWYDAQQNEYVFSKPVTGDFTLFASWEDTTPGVKYCKFTFDKNYYGVAPKTQSPPSMLEGSTVTKPADPVRADYKFEGWFTAPTGGSQYVFSTPVMQDTTVYAQWTKTKTGTSTYIYEAENLDLRGKYGPGISGTGNEGSMLVGDTQGKGASGGRYLSFLYAYTTYTSVTFNLACDEAVTDATIMLRLSAEVESWTMTPDNYSVTLNGEIIAYTPIEFKDVPPMVSADTPGMLPFKDYVMGINIPLRAGTNEITLTTNNNIPYDSTTMEAHAPLVDCLKITTSAVVIWDGNYELPYQW